jgi:hypothetical protein
MGVSKWNDKKGEKACRNTMGKQSVKLSLPLSLCKFSKYEKGAVLVACCDTKHEGNKS